MPDIDNFRVYVSHSFKGFPCGWEAWSVEARVVGGESREGQGRNVGETQCLVTYFYQVEPKPPKFPELHKITLHLGTMEDTTDSYIAHCLSQT